MTDADGSRSPAAGDPMSGTTPTGTFEDRLLRELQTLAAEAPVPLSGPARRRPRRTLVAAAAMAAVLAVAAIIVPTVLLGGHGARAAYAVQRRSNGMVSLQIRGVIAAPGAVEQDLKRAGAPVRVLAADTRQRCRPAHPVSAPAGLLSRTGPRTFVIDPHKIPHGTVLVAQVPVRGHAGPLRLSLNRTLPRC